MIDKIINNTKSALNKLTEQVEWRNLGTKEILTALCEAGHRIDWGEDRQLWTYAGLVFCPPSDQGEVIAALAISFSVWQCAGHGDAAGLGFVH